MPHLLLYYGQNYMQLDPTLLIFVTEEDAKIFFLGLIFDNPEDVHYFNLILNPTNTTLQFDKIANMDRKIKFKNSESVIFDKNVWKFPVVAAFCIDFGISYCDIRHINECIYE